MEALFLFGLAVIGLLVYAFEDGLLCPYNLHKYQHVWRFNNQIPSTRSEFNIVRSSEYLWTAGGDYSVVWVKSGKEVLFQATSPGYDCIMAHRRPFRNADVADLFIREFYTQPENLKTEYKGHTIYKVFKGDANSHPDFAWGNIFYTTSDLSKRIHASSLEALKARIDALQKPIGYERG